MTRGSAPPLDPVLRSTLAELFDEGWELWARFDRDVRSRRWHSFVPGDYERILSTLLALRSPGQRFLEWGSAMGVVTIMADLLGWEAYGIELENELVVAARDLALRYGSSARFVTGSFLPTGYVWRPRDGDDRTGTLGEGPSGYLAMYRPLDDFDLVYAYPWDGEEDLMRDLMRANGGRDASLLLQQGSGDVQIFRRDRLVAATG